MPAGGGGDAGTVGILVQTRLLLHWTLHALISHSSSSEPHLSQSPRVVVVAGAGVVTKILGDVTRVVVDSLLSSCAVRHDRSSTRKQN